MLLLYSQFSDRGRQHLQWCAKLAGRLPTTARASATLATLATLAPAALTATALATTTLVPATLAYYATSALASSGLLQFVQQLGS